MLLLLTSHNFQYHSFESGKVMVVLNYFNAVPLENQLEALDNDREDSYDLTEST